MNDMKFRESEAERLFSLLTEDIPVHRPELLQLTLERVQTEITVLDLFEHFSSVFVLSYCVPFLGIFLGGEVSPGERPE